jgi:hypothetical protein
MNLLQATHFMREFFEGHLLLLSVHYSWFVKTVVKKYTYGVEGQTNQKMF